MRRRCGCFASERGLGNCEFLAAAQGFLHGDDLDGNVADFGEEAVKDRAAQQDVEA
jgi:hypothetical protein